MSLCPEVNSNLDQDLEDIPKETGTFHCLDYVYESSSEDEEIEPIDEGYLKFLEVTIKHQQELRDRRTAQTTDSLDQNFGKIGFYADENLQFIFIW